MGVDTRLPVGLGFDTPTAWASMRHRLGLQYPTGGEWYDGYRFAATANTEPHNTDMVLYYLKQSIRLGAAPENLINANVRIDYRR